MLPNKPYKGNQIPNQPFYAPEVPATFDRLFGARVANEQLDPNPSDSQGGWVRPADWLPMPNISETEEKFAGLFAVYDTPENFIALYVEGNFTVDWGDGSIENYTSGETAQHSYSWIDIPSDTTTTEGYRQVMVTVTPQDGESFTYLDLTVRHDNILTTGESSSPWLDIAVSMPEGEFMCFSGYYWGINTNGYLQQVQRIDIIHAGGMTDFYDAFIYLYALKYVRIRKSPNLLLSGDGFLEAFYGCESLIEVYLEDTSDVGSMESAFEGCESLQTVEISDTSNVALMNTMFSGCTSLIRVPEMDTSNVINMGRMFEYCTSLTAISPLDTSSVTAMYSMFQGCNSITTVPILDTSKVEDMEYMFFDCPSLCSIPQLDTSNVEDMYYMFGACQSLSKIPTFDASSLTSAEGMFSSCSSLQAGTLVGISTDISYYNCLLGHQAIVDIFNGLATASATIDVRNNYGAADLTAEDLAIATNKGWTVLS